jgi:hypothetical protein
MSLVKLWPCQVLAESLCRLGQGSKLCILRIAECLYGDTRIFQERNS